MLIHHYDHKLNSFLTFFIFPLLCVMLLGALVTHLRRHCWEDCRDRSRSRSREQRREDWNSQRFFLKNTQNLEDWQLEKHFQRYGYIVSCNVLMDKRASAPEGSKRDRTWMEMDENLLRTDRID